MRTTLSIDHNIVYPPVVDSSINWNIIFTGIIVASIFIIVIGILVFIIKKSMKKEDY